MWVRRLRLHEFRNHGETLVDLADGPVVLAGPNGGGKTSILEAVCVLATAKSFRTADDSVLVRAGSERAMVEADVVLAGREVRVGVAFGDVDRRFFLNGVAQRSHKDIALVRAVVFSPDDLQLCKGPPGERRDFLDAAISNTSPAGTALLADWARVLRQRNTLLKSLRGTRTEKAPSALGTWTEMLADRGADLVMARTRVLARMRPHIVSAVAGLSGLDAVVAYKPTWAGESTVDEADRDGVRAALADALAERGGEELERGITLVGPHRDDITLAVSGRDSRAQASQGEQRVVALALRLGELGLMGEVFDDPPILLLDDVFSELDPDRRSRLLERLPRAQTLITTTAAADVDGPPPDIVAALSAAGLLESDAPVFKRVVDAKVVD